MIAQRSNLTPAEMRDQAQRWFDRQIAVLSEAHGDKWPEHEGWIRDYLAEEIRQHLIALGWRPKGSKQ